MAIAFVNCRSQPGNSANPTVPRTSTTNGNLAICGIATAAGQITAAPAGWTLIDEINYTGTQWLATYWRETTSGDPASFVWTAPSGRWSCVNIEFSGAAVSTPVDVKSKDSGASSVSVVAPSIDPNFTNDGLIFFGAAASTATWTPQASPLAFTEPSSADSADRPAASAITIGGSYHLAANGAPTGAVTATASSAAAWGAQLIAFKDASPVADSPDPASHPLAATAALPLVTAAYLGNIPAAEDRAVDGMRWVYSRSAGKVGRRINA